MAASCENGNELPGFHKLQDTSLLDEQLLASQKDFLSIESFIYCHLGRMLQVQRTFCLCLL
jgi:hypothetical protein